MPSHASSVNSAVYFWHRRPFRFRKQVAANSARPVLAKMDSLAHKLSSLNTQETPSSTTLDQLPEDIIQVIVSFLQIEPLGSRRNAPLSWVEKDAQDNVFRRAPWNADLDSLAMVSRRMREETFSKNRLRVVRVKDTEEDLVRTDKVIPHSKRHHVRYVPDYRCTVVN